MSGRKACAILIALTLVIPALVYGASVFRLRPPITVDRDDRAVPKKPGVREVSLTFAIINNSWLRRLDAEEVFKKKRPALNVNAWDEVPDSSWFTNRIGVRPIAFDEIDKGIEGAPPGPPLWKVLKWNDAGYTPKVNIDAGGMRYVLKFDPPGARERNSGAERVGTLIFYAAGYNVPHNTIVYYQPEDLNLEGAYYLDKGTGLKLPLTPEYLGQVFSKLERMPSGPHRGMYRGIASQFLPEGLGPFVFHGRRKDDPNDIIPHEMRRELRGLRVIGSWVNHVDIKDAQAIDTFYTAPDGRKFVKHYLLDFSATLGAYEWPSAPYRVGHEYMFDGATMSRSLLSLGVWRPKWEVRGRVVHPEIGYFDSELFDPPAWKPSFPNLAFEEMDGGDAYWGAKIVTAFSDDLIRQIVEAGEYSRPEVSRYLEDVLKKRRDAIGAYWLNRMTPLEDIKLTRNGSDIRMQFLDLAIQRGYAEAASRSYRYWIENLDGRRLTKELTSSGKELELAGLSDLISKATSQPADKYGRTPLLRVVVQSKWTSKEWARPTEVFIGRNRGSENLEVLGWAHAAR